MKKIGVLFGILVMFSIFSLGFAAAEACDLSVSMINQDPYPAIQGEEVKIVFQIDGIGSTECGTIDFELIEQYPVSILSGSKKSYTIESGTFIKDYKSFFLAPFRVKVNENAIDGDNTIEVRYRGAKNVGWETKQFDLNVQDTRADFEVHVKEYDLTTRTITFEILNIAESDIEALTIEVPKQDNIIIKGSNREIVGDLDSNEYTTADFEAIPSDGKIEVSLKYSDSINERRIVDLEVDYDGEYFTGLLKDEKPSPTKNYIIIGVIIFLIIWWQIRKQRKRKELKEKLKSRK